MRDVLRAVALAVVLASCHQTFNNPADSLGGAYVGYQTVREVSGVRPDLPADGATVQWLAFACSLCPAADAYEMELSDSADAVVHTSESNRFVLSEGNLAAGSYTWRVRARATGGEWGEWSAAAGVVLDSGITGASPADAATTEDTTPLLDWADVAGATFEVQIATSAAGLDAATPVASSGSQYQVPAALAYGAWYWRARAVNADGVPAAWSTTWSFVTAPLVAMVTVTGGTFQMGSVGVAEPVHSVTVSSFLIGKYEVTQGQYQTVIGANPSYFTGGVGAPNRPVEQVTWYNAVAFCNALSALEGLTACYTINGMTVIADFTKKGYRLPTEAEWEYAARGGTSSGGYTYAGSNDVNAVAWYSSNAGPTTHAVGTKAANELGIYDMSGNVLEWCWDWYWSYGSSAQTNPTGATSGSYRVLRGGSWADDAGYAGVANRDVSTPSGSYSNLGFRPVRAP